MDLPTVNLCTIDDLSKEDIKKQAKELRTLKTEKEAKKETKKEKFELTLLKAQKAVKTVNNEVTFTADRNKELNVRTDNPTRYHEKINETLNNWETLIEAVFADQESWLPLTKPLTVQPLVWPTEVGTLPKIDQMVSDRGLVVAKLLKENRTGPINSYTNVSDSDLMHGYLSNFSELRATEIPDSAYRIPGTVVYYFESVDLCPTLGHIAVGENGSITLTGTTFDVLYAEANDTQKKTIVKNLRAGFAAFFAMAASFGKKQSYGLNFVPPRETKASTTKKVKDVLKSVSKSDEANNRAIEKAQEALKTAQETKKKRSKNAKENENLLSGEDKFLPAGFVSVGLTGNNSLEGITNEVVSQLQGGEVNWGQWKISIPLPLPSRGRPNIIAWPLNSSFFDDLDEDEEGKPPHPHVNSAGRFCTGDQAARDLEKASLAGNLTELFNISRALLQHYNPGGPYLNIENYLRDSDQETADEMLKNRSKSKVCNYCKANSETDDVCIPCVFSATNGNRACDFCERIGNLTCTQICRLKNQPSGLCPDCALKTEPGKGLSHYVEAINECEHYYGACELKLAQIRTTLTERQKAQITSDLDETYKTLLTKSKKLSEEASEAHKEEVKKNGAHTAIDERISS